MYLFLYFFSICNCNNISNTGNIYIEKRKKQHTTDVYFSLILG